MAVRQQDRPEDEPRDPALDRVYAAGPREEPPSRLDAAILAAARREVHARPRPPGSMLRRWRAPVALAAVLVLSVTVVLLMREEGAERLADSPASRALPPPVAERERASEDARRREEQVQHAPQPKAVTPQEKAGTRLGDTPQPGAASAEEDRRKAEKYRQQNRLEAAREKPRPPEPRPSPRPFAEAPAPPVEPKLSAPESGPSPADALAKRTQPGAPAGQALERAEREQQPAQRPPVPPAVQAPPPAAAAPDSAVGGVAPPPSRAAKPAAPESGSAARQGMRDDAAAVSRPVWQGYEKEPPEKWLERVEELNRAGRGAEAREMLAEFRKRFPQHPVPATLER